MAAFLWALLIAACAVGYLIAFSPDMFPTNKVVTPDISWYRRYKKPHNKGGGVFGKEFRVRH